MFLGSGMVLVGLATFNLPIAGIAVLLGADAVMDMARTSTNLLGNCMTSAVMAKWEGVDLDAQAALTAQELQPALEASASAG